MNNKDAATIAVLAGLKLRQEDPLTPEDEALLQSALNPPAVDPEEEHYKELLRLFKSTRRIT